ncbi:MFS transporter [Jiangella anatolica]|uniref:MFS transporter n=1 Tax=Jiangella anatolica TaxID=2670374 RepID=A0A2W2BXM2_9ACTN|nr:MFS transporter [Jiangella anatolica]PZF80819.1 MFS transporter [Jiangella anatolica]
MNETVVTPHPWRWRILGFLGVAQLMLILDVTVVAIALPQIETDLGASRAALTWTVSAYALAFGGLMLLGGRLADILGAKRVVLAGLLVFSAASLLTGLADSSELLIAGRVAQGVGAALLSPSALSLVVTLFDGDERNRALGVWSALGGGGAALGVLLGGLLTAGPGWPWVFYVNVPIGLVIAAVLARMLPRPVVPASRGRLDVLGALLVTASTGTLIYALIQAGEDGWATATTGLLVLAAAAGYLVFVAWQRRAGTPLMDVRLLARRPVATGTFLILLATALMIAVFFLGTFYFQHAHSYGPLRTGLLFLPVALATMAGANLTGRSIARFGARPLAVAGLLVAAAGLAVPALWLEPAVVVVGVAVAAAGTGAIFVVASATALGQVAPHEAGVASGIVSTFHEFGAAGGAAVVSSIAAASIVGDTLDGFTNAFVVAAVAAGVSALVASVLTPRPQA